MAPPAALPQAARTRSGGIPVPAEDGWVDIKEAADRAQVSTRTLFRWCATGAIVARRLARGRGPWRIRLDRDGFPMDAPEAAGGAP
jgi:hypothetical protein